jgi:amino acid adenylation domain-containing protein
MFSSCVCYLEETAAKFPDKLAVVDEHQRYTFRELRERALRLSGLIPAEWTNQPIAVYLPKSADAIVAFMGILYSGNFYVPLDPKSPAERLAKVVQNLSPRAVITGAGQVGFVGKFSAAAKPRIIVPNLDDASDSKTGSVPLPDRIKRVIDTDPIYCIYTSGSTGEPKGVLIPHRGVIDYIEWATSCYGITENEVIGNQSPFFFDNSTLDIYLMLKTGATLFLLPEIVFAFPVKLIDYLCANCITFIFWVPSVMIQVTNLNLLEGRQLPPLGKVLFAGEVMPCKTLNYWRKHFPKALFSNLYGPTEITVDCTYYNVDREFGESDSLPIGIPCRNTDILVLNGENLLVKGDEIGELCVRGSSLALGYWNDRAKTDSAFAQNPLNPHYPEKIYHTGDLVKYNEQGELLFLGRKDSQIKHAGYRIELGEIETAVSGLKGIDHACVVYQAEKAAIALFYVSGDLALDETTIRKALSEVLPKYMIPTVFRKLETLPLNANGKVDRLALRKSL